MLNKNLCLQDADFMYLTGVTQPNCVAMFGGDDSPAPGYTLFVPEPSDHVSHDSL